jgi:hypothetical protein
VILAADCSGSCSAVCDDTLIACLAIARKLPHVVVVRNSNGIVIEATGALAAQLPDVSAMTSTGLAQIPRLLGCKVACTVAFGDWDAGDEYRDLAASSAPLYWLDSYASRAGARIASRNLRVAASHWRHQPVGWWQGVNDASRAAFALRSMAR